MATDNERPAVLSNLIEMIYILRISRQTMKRWLKQDHHIKSYIFKLAGWWNMTVYDRKRFLDEQKEPEVARTG